MGGLRLAEFDHGFSPAKCDLSFDFTRSADGFACSLTWHADLFTAARIDRLVEHLDNLAAAVVVQPQRPLGELNLLSAAERKRLLVDFTPPSSQAKPDTLTAWFAREALARPNAIAVRSDGASWTFSELDGRANRLAHVLRARGVTRENVVAVALERGFAWIETMLADDEGRGHLSADRSESPAGAHRHDAARQWCGVGRDFAGIATGRRWPGQRPGAGRPRRMNLPQRPPPHRAIRQRRKTALI